MLKILVYGSSGHAKVVADIVESAGKNEIIAFIDDTRSEDGSFLQYPVYTSISNPALEGISAGIVAIGDNWGRASIIKKIVRQIPYFKFITAIHPSAQIGRGVHIGEGTVVMPGVIINADTIIGRHCIVNTASSLDHDCVLEDYASLAPGVTVGGNVSVGTCSAIGLGANIVHKVRIGHNSIVGAGSLVTKTLPDGIVAYGSPCKFVRDRSDGYRYL